MTLLHIEGFDVIDSTTKSALVGIDMSHQTSNASSHGDLTTFDVTGRYTGSTCLQKAYEKCIVSSFDEEAGTTNRNRNIGFCIKYN